MNVQAGIRGRLGLVAGVAVVLALAGCSGDDGGGGSGTPVATKTNTAKPATTPTSTATRAAATPTSPNGSTPTATATPTMAFASGTYSASFALPNNRTAHLNLSVGGDGQASGTLELVDGEGGASAIEDGELVRGLAISAGLVSLSGGINVSNGTFQFGGSIAGPQGSIPFDISGTLPGPGGGGEVTLTVNGQSYSASLNPGSGPTPLPTAGPTPAGECTGANIHLTFSNVSPDANPEQTLDSIDMPKGSGNLGAGVFGANIAKCPVEVFGVSRVFGVALYLMGGQVFEPGLTVSLEDTGILANRVEYAEATAGPSLKKWRSKGGTLTIDAVDGNKVTFHVTGAHMEPGPPFPFGAPPMGTFDLNASGDVTVMIF